MTRTVPNLFIVGAPKSGTTSLYHYLGQHPQIYMCPVKEPYHFASEVRRENLAAAYRGNSAFDPVKLNGNGGSGIAKRFGGIVETWSDYLRLFDDVDGEIAVGEASVCYLWSPTAARNIASRIPHAKIVAVLRHPVDRAWSQYLHGVANGYIRATFRQHVEACIDSPRAEFSPVWPFLEFGA